MRNLLKKFLTLGVIVGPLPNNIADGQAIDAIPLMADLNWLVSQVNGNASSTSDMNSAITTAVSAVGNTITTYTPTIISSGGASPAYTNQFGASITIGHLVLVWGSLLWTTNGTGNLQLRVSLPATVNATFGGNASATPPSFLTAGPISIASALYFAGYPVQGQQYMTLAAVINNGLQSQVTWASFGGAGAVVTGFVNFFSVFYT